MSTPPSALRGLRARFGRISWRDPDTHFMALAVVVGVLGGGGAIVFRKLTALITKSLTGRDDIIAAARALPPVWRVLIPALGGLVGGFIARRFVRTGGTMGIAQIMEVVAVGKRTVKFRQSAARTASSLVVIATGGSEGREGPIIQMAAAFAAVVGRWFRVSPDRGRILVACGMAAGVAGAYNTPISATLFVVELVVGSFSMSVFGPAIVSSVVSSLVTRAVVGDAPLYRVPPFHLGSAIEFLPYVPLGLLSGIGAVVFMRTLRLAKRGFRATGLRDEWRMLIGGAGVGAIGLLYPEVWGNGFEGTNLILASHWAVLSLAALCLAKLAATSLTIGSGGVGGVFTPALMVGAALGAAFGIVVQDVFPGLPSAPIYCFALLGMGGVLAGTTRAPFLAIIMMFELSGSSAVIVPMMLVSILAILGARLFERESIYVEELREAGVEWQASPQETALATMRAKDVMRTDVTVVSETLKLSEVASIFLESRLLQVYVCDANGRLLGAIELHDLKHALSDEALGELVIARDLSREITTVTPDESLASVNEKLWFRDYGQLPVVDRDSGRLLGTIARRDVLGAIDREILRGNKMLARVVRGPGHGEFFELPPDHRLVVIEVPLTLVGRRLADSQLRERHGVHVLALRRVDRDGTDRAFVPRPDEVLCRGDRLSVLATDAALEQLTGVPGGGHGR